MSEHVPYSEHLMAHQCPIQGISEWQDWNDLGEAIRWREIDDELDADWDANLRNRVYAIAGHAPDHP